MCVSCQKFYQTIVLMLSLDNPNRICRPDSTCYRFWNCLFVMSLIIFSSVIFYFVNVGLGYGMTYMAVGNIYNMTTGYKHGINSCLIYNDCSMCSYDMGNRFYGGCFIVGIICDLILCEIVFCGRMLYWYWIECVSNMRSEITSSFESAKNIRDKYVADPNPNSINQINFTTTSDE